MDVDDDANEDDVERERNILSGSLKNSKGGYDDLLYGHKAGTLIYSVNVEH
jgi:hypothetical protein